MLDRIKDYLKEIFSSRLIPISIIFFLLFFILIVRMFNLQIVRSDEINSNNTVSEEKQRDILSTRGNIHDRNGVLLASNQISYSVTIEDTGQLTTNEEKNEMMTLILTFV